MNFQEYLYLLWVLVVGAIGGVLGLLDDDGKPRKHRTRLAFAVATLTAMFLCWTTFAIAKLVIHEVQGSLALGGIVAFMGAEWVRRKINKATDKKIEGLGDNGYGGRGKDYDDYGGSFRHEEWKDDK